jgi:hypothetical protein
MGLSAALFVLLLRALYPITSTTTQEIFTPDRLEKRFVPGFTHGAMIAAGVTLAFLLSGAYRYLGFFIQFEEAPLAAITVVVRVVALGSFAYFEEFIFRHKLTGDFRRQIWGARPPGFVANVGLALAVAVLYCSIKWIQFGFELGVMQLTTLFLLSVALSARALIDTDDSVSPAMGAGDFARGAGFWAALLIVFQPLLSLPMLGSDFSGLILVKYQVDKDVDPLTRFFTGGPGGPLSSFALQALLAIDAVRGLLLYKKRLDS